MHRSFSYYMPCNHNISNPTLYVIIYQFCTQNYWSPVQKLTLLIILFWVRPSPLCSAVSAVTQFITKIEFSYSSKAIFYSFSFPCTIRSKGTPLSAQPLSMLLALTSPLSWGIIGVSYADYLYIASLVLIARCDYRLRDFSFLIGFKGARAFAHPPVSFFTKTASPPAGGTFW